MEGTKLDIAGKEKEKEALSPSATYKPIPEDDMEDHRPKSNSVGKEDKSHEPDGADEKMLKKDDTKVAPDSNINLTEIKFTTNEKNGDAKLDIGELKNEFVGLTKEELMKTANDPFWVRLRWLLFISFWLLWAGMLIGAIMIIIAAPKCTPPQPKTWFEEGPITIIGEDLDADDTQNLATNYNAFILNGPRDSYLALNETLQLEAFLFKNKDMNIILELDPSVSEKWFVSSENKDTEYNDFYIWRDPKSGNVDNNYPNNWLAKSSTDDAKTSAWKYSEKRKQFYYAPAHKPQLNFRNKKVVEEFNKVLKEYMDFGVDGFMLTHVPGLLVDSNFDDESPRSDANNLTLYNYKFYTHHKTEDLDDLQPIIREWRDVVKNKSDTGVLMMGDVITSPQIYLLNQTLLVDLPLQHTFARDKLDASKLLKEIENAYDMSEDNWPAWMVSNEAYPNGTLEMVAYLLKGSPILNKNYIPSEELREARKSAPVLFGTQKLYTAANDTVFAYTRAYPGNPGYLVAFNPTNEKVEVDFPQDIPEIPEEVTVQYFSTGYNETDVGIRLKKSAHNFPMSPRSAIVLSYVPKPIK